MENADANVSKNDNVKNASIKCVLLKPVLINVSKNVNANAKNTSKDINETKAKGNNEKEKVRIFKQKEILIDCADLCRRKRIVGGSLLDDEPQQRTQ